MSEVGMEETNRPVTGIRPPPPQCMEDNLSENGKLSENATVQSRILRPEGVNKVDLKPKRKTPAQTEREREREREREHRHKLRQRERERECSACAPRHGPNKELCPAFGKTCNGKKHFDVKCKLSRKKRVQTITTQQYERENDISSVSDYGQRNN